LPSARRGKRTRPRAERSAPSRRCAPPKKRHRQTRHHRVYPLGNSPFGLSLGRAPSVWRLSHEHATLTNMSITPGAVVSHPGSGFSCCRAPRVSGCRIACVSLAVGLAAWTSPAPRTSDAGAQAAAGSDAAASAALADVGRDQLPRLAAWPARPPTFPAGATPRQTSLPDGWQPWTIHITEKNTRYRLESTPTGTALRADADSSRLRSRSPGSPSTPSPRPCSPGAGRSTT
jgi:hypothetical protein